MKYLQFINFLNNISDINPTLIESIKSGFSAIFEDSTETQVENIKDTLNVEKVTTDISAGKYYKPKVETPVLDETIPPLEDLGADSTDSTETIENPI